MLTQTVFGDKRLPLVMLFSIAVMAFSTKDSHADARVKLKSFNTIDQCLAVQGGSVDNGAVIIQETCHRNYLRQEWNIMDNGQIQSVKSMKCLTVGGSADSTPIVQKTCQMKPSQLWNVVPGAFSPNGVLQTILGRESQKCVDVKDASHVSGTAVILFTCNNGNNQKWFFGIP